jgi:hypothetical protein
LRFGLSIDGTEVASDELVTDAAALDGETTLSGVVTDADGYTAADFEPEVASSISETIQVDLSFEVMAQGDDVIVSDTASDEGTVTVSHPQKQQFIAEVGGSGEFVTPR